MECFCGNVDHLRAASRVGSSSSGVLVRRLVNRRLFLDRDYERWRNVLSGEIVRITRCTSLPESLTKLCAYLNVPQRCLVAVSELSFTITYFQGKHALAPVRVTRLFGNNIAE